MLVMLKPILQLYSFSGKVHAIRVGGFHKIMDFFYKGDDFIEISVHFGTYVLDLVHKWMKVLGKVLYSLCFVLIKLHDFL